MCDEMWVQQAIKNVTYAVPHEFNEVRAFMRFSGTSRTIPNALNSVFTFTTSFGVTYRLVANARIPSLTCTGVFGKARIIFGVFIKLKAYEWMNKEKIEFNYDHAIFNLISTNTKVSIVMPVATDMNSLSASHTGASIWPSICWAHLKSKFGFTQMKIISHFATTIPFLSVTRTFNWRQRSMFFGFGPDAYILPALMIPFSRIEPKIDKNVRVLKQLIFKIRILKSFFFLLKFTKIIKNTSRY